MKKSKISFFVVAIVLTCLISCFFIQSVSTEIFAFADESSICDKVYLGGNPIGIVSYSDRCIIEDFRYIITSEGVKLSKGLSNLKIGDIIIKIDNKDVYTVKDITDILQNKNETHTFTIERNNNFYDYCVSPLFDIVEKAYKTGIVIKNQIAGIGTMTYINPNNNRFGALGHRIFDDFTMDKSLYNSGILLDATIKGSNKASKDNPGELVGIIENCEIGKVDRISFNGVFGKYTNSINNNTNLIEIGNKDQVLPGKAYIYTSIYGNCPQKYEIEIIKAVNQNTPSEKSMVIRVIDTELLEKTGGILRGMSGSPIIQNDKLVGAVTHVFINDSKYGYGIYIDWMINN